MFSASNRITDIIPFKVLKAAGVTLVLENPKNIKVPTAGKGALNLSQWRPNWMADLLSHLTPHLSGTFIDVGANVGQTLLAYISANGGDAYLGIEPNPICAGFVDELILGNGLKNFTVIALALSDNNGFSHLYTAYPTDTSATMVTNLRPVEGRHPQVIPTCTLDYLVSSLAISKIGLIKIDVEAHELEVIRGVQQTLAAHKPLVICEVLGTAKGKSLDIKKPRNAEIITILSKLNYSIYRIKKDKNENTVIGIEPLKTFPDIHWSEENKHQFDYLFIPQERVEEMQNILN